MSTETVEYISAAEFARRVGVTRQAVHKGKGSRYTVTEQGIPWPQAREEWERSRRLDKDHRAATRPSAGAPPREPKPPREPRRRAPADTEYLDDKEEYNRNNAEAKKWDARTRKLRYLEMRGVLIPKAVIQKVLGQALGMIAQKVMALPHRHAPAIAAACARLSAACPLDEGALVNEIATLLDADLRGILNEVEKARQFPD